MYVLDVDTAFVSMIALGYVDFVLRVVLENFSTLD